MSALPIGPATTIDHMTKQPAERRPQDVQDLEGRGAEGARTIPAASTSSAAGLEADDALGAKSTAAGHPSAMSGPSNTQAFAEENGN